ncbi:Zinc finger protein CONSTANS-LIKE 9 [Abeliophyllum distichum]|uniref:Zinc finger protein CONSTANS-LIKE 9 n=1 Tax=Abeliophyllum distichum TaxID=126358 RepID=A0ABD1QHW8_9LAMI
MGQVCDFCGEQRSMVYCRSDAACLCLSCDRTVHSANALSRRHSGTLICERCNSQPVAVRCIEEEISLCENCNWSSHAAPASAAGHKPIVILDALLQPSFLVFGHSFQQIIQAAILK